MILMSVLSPKAGALIDAGRSVIRATDGDRDRIEAALRARLGAAALPLEAPVAPPKAAPVPRAAWRAVVPAIGVGAVGVALMFAFRPAQTPKPAPSRSEVQAPEAKTAAPIASAEPTAPTPETAISPPSSAVVPGAAAALPQRDPLTMEVALLSRATSALSSGRFGEALKVLKEHQRQFPNGLLSEERRAGQAQALCSLGRVADGRAQLSHLSPRSPAATRAGSVCDSAAARLAAKEQ
jgi:hypothetical protein